MLFFQWNKEVVFEEQYADSTEEKIDSILIISAGNSITRAFLEDLSERVTKGFNKKKIVTHSYFLGKSVDDLKKVVDSINKTGYKAILYFLPSVMSRYGIDNSENFSRTKRSNVRYLQRFNFQLCKSGNNMKRIWSASVDVDCNQGNASAAKTITNKLLSRFQINKYIE